MPGAIWTHTEDELMDGQMNIFDYIPKPEPTKEEEFFPCEICDIIYGSKECFLRMGYMWNDYDHKWLRDKNGEFLRIGLDKRDCKYEPRNLNLQCFSSEKVGINGIRTGRCYHTEPIRCEECPEFVWMWAQIDELRADGYKLNVAMEMIKRRWGIPSAYADVLEREEVQE